MSKKRLIISMVVGLLLVLCLAFMFSDRVKDVELNSSSINANTAMVDLDYYIYIDSEYNLCKAKENDSNKIVIDSLVIAFELNDKSVIYSKKDGDFVQLYMYSMETASIKKLFAIKTNDYIVKSGSIYYTDGFVLKKYSITTGNSVNIKTLLSTDVVLNYICDDFVVLSYQTAGHSYSDKLSINGNDEQHMLTDVYNVGYYDGRIYGINKDGFLCRTKDGLRNVDTIENLSMVKFDIQKDFLFYINERGQLNSLDNSGTNRVISEYATDFRILSDNIYFMVSTDKNVVYKVGFTGSPKAIVLDDVGNDFYFDSFNSTWR